MKEYNIKRYYCTKHEVKFDGIEGQFRFDEIEQFKMSLSIQEVFHAHAKDNELITKLSFEISELIAEKEIVYSDGEFIRIVWSCSPDVCFQKNMCGGAITVSLSRFAVARRFFEKYRIFKQKISKCSAFSIALGKSKDVSDTAQLVFRLSHQYFYVTCKLIEKFFTIHKIITTAVFA